MSPKSVVEAAPGWFRSSLRAGLWLIGTLGCLFALEKKKDYATRGERVIKLTSS